MRSLRSILRPDSRTPVFVVSVARGLLQMRNQIMFGAIQAESRMPELIFDPLDSAGAEEGGYGVYRLGRNVFRLNKADPRAQPERKLGTNPFAWLNEAIVPRKEKNSFETCLTQYQPAAVCKMLARRT